MYFWYFNFNMFIRFYCNFICCSYRINNYKNNNFFKIKIIKMLFNNNNSSWIEIIRIIFFLINIIYRQTNSLIFINKGKGKFSKLY